MPRLSANTIVRNPDDQSLHVLKAGQDVPEWAVEQVGDHLLDGATAAPAKDEKPNGSNAGAGGEITEPPRAGRGSGLDAWTAYAEHLGIAVPDGAQRDDVIELVDQHNEK